MSVRGIVNAARTLVHYERLQRILANNLANVSTDGFKGDLFTLQRDTPGGAPVPVTAFDLSQGSFRPTGRQLDVALQGPGFFVVETADGERLTRGGSLKLDPAGRLVDMHDEPLLGENGPIIITGAEMEIQTDGSVVVDGVRVDQLRIETVADTSTLEKDGKTRFVATAGTIAAEPSTEVHQGAIEESNSDAILSTIDLITVAREFEANMSALRAMDGVLENVVNDVGRPLP